eukprot:CAMPEP_0174721468 /NCGR_PEP_ID=MMETSP1094-20130205/36272_1 /TAXON_ID=156173 /ORGANISM="Chrysochromulina brevifilum, Strain UTEX LB 985" /LENGTH=150 /DNA_ID=CAMNT_0015922169 /DNA_START=508 /DNA_END=960 /DNA_ORIENTATION=-
MSIAGRGGLRSGDVASVPGRVARDVRKGCVPKALDIAQTSSVALEVEGWSEAPGRGARSIKLGLLRPIIGQGLGVPSIDEPKPLPAEGDALRTSGERMCGTLGTEKRSFVDLERFGGLDNKVLSSSRKLTENERGPSLKGVVPWLAPSGK